VWGTRQWMRRERGERGMKQRAPPNKPHTQERRVGHPAESRLTLANPALLESRVGHPAGKYGYSENHLSVFLLSASNRLRLQRAGLVRNWTRLRIAQVPHRAAESSCEANRARLPERPVRRPAPRGNMVARDRFASLLSRNEIDEPAVRTWVLSHWQAIVQARRRILEDGTPFA
jgi:hypothetical protein